MADRRQMDIELYAAIGELRTDIKYIVKASDENKMAILAIRDALESQCDDCEPAKKIDLHLLDHKETTMRRGERTALWITSGVAIMVGLGPRLYERLKTLFNQM